MHYASCCMHNRTNLIIFNVTNAKQTNEFISILLVLNIAKCVRRTFNAKKREIKHEIGANIIVVLCKTH